MLRANQYLLSPGNGLSHLRIQFIQRITAACPHIIVLIPLNTRYENIARLLSHQSHVASVFLIQLPQFLLPVNVRFIKCIHGTTAQIITTVAEVTGSTALVQTLLYNADPLFSRCIFDQYTFDLHMPSPFLIYQYYISIIMKLPDMR